MFIRLTKTLGMLTVATFAVACSAAGEGSGGESVGGSFDPITMPAHEIDLVVELVNSPTTTAEMLDADIGLDSRAAANIIAHRSGPDGIYPSADDDRFESLEELDRVPFVGESALRKLRDWAVAHPAAQAELVEGVQFSSEQASAVVWGVNHASLPELDIELGLTSSAAANLIAGAPYDSVSEIGAVNGVGPAALTTLRNQAPVWAAEMSQGEGPGQGGTYDGINFDDATAEIALSIANTASYAQLTGEGGLYSGGANAIVAGRPFSTLGALSDTYGIGQASMRSLHDYAVSGKFSAGSAHQ